MTVVSDTCLLRDLYGEIIFPPAVAQELGRNGMPIRPPWARVVAPQDQNDVEFCGNNDPGEAEAIVVAGELVADLLLVDEKRGA